ncbi:E3 ubiquitin-protein ligase TRIM56 [Holothuria leucospilota]|uniref:E3 ubiquitin-protein ligase TRIM56 n=1 Tax=Holothuria leucospilota TaxID=206669 RepID=A0A9Q1BTI3_HOLLE|nr:E3 ubiquitin-protein ligase TRIM56 [Holothuria leucospilota]
MASGSPLKDIDENFCQCSICLEQFREPKLLPCLHRYCRDCLQHLLQDCHGLIKCPDCRQEFPVPNTGVEAFKTDFYMKNIIEYIQLQNSVKDDQVRECCGCVKKIKVTAYCFKCNDFLCNECYKYHVTNKTLKDHKQHTLSLDDVKSKNLTLEKLASLKEAPRCHTHSEKLSELCCATCLNLPVCVACTYGKHKGHELHEVTERADVERQNLQKKLQNIFKRKEKIFQMPDLLEKMKGNVTSDFDARKAETQQKHGDEINKITADMKKLIEISNKKNIDYEKEKERNVKRLKEQMEQELQEIKKKYENAIEVETKKAEQQLKDFQRSFEGQFAVREGELQKMNLSLRDSISSIESDQKETLEKIQEVSDHCKNTIKRFNNLTATASSILASKNDWTSVQCIPDICGAIEPLVLEMERDYPELNDFADMQPDEFEIDLEGLRDEGWLVSGVTGCDDGSIAITGCTSGRDVHITWINQKGETLRHDKMQKSCNYPWRFCASLSSGKIAVVGEPNDIEVYNLRDGSSLRKKLCDIIHWPAHRDVTCATSDAKDRHIMVGGRDSTDVYVFDERLSYQRNLSLPGVIKWPRDIAVIAGYLLVCDSEGKKAYALSMAAENCTILSEFAKPALDGTAKWGPFSVCTDKNGLVYMLWRSIVSGQWKSVIGQYNVRDWRTLSTREVDGDARCLTTVDTGKRESLVVATNKSGKIYIYNLVKTWRISSIP